jgi:hypothetical protein
VGGLPIYSQPLGGSYEVQFFVVSDTAGLPLSLVTVGAYNAAVIYQRSSGGTALDSSSDPASTAYGTVTRPIPARYSAATHSVLGCTTSSQTAAASNSARKYALFVNDSDTVIYLFFGTPAVANQGIRLNAAGGSYEINQQNMYTGQVCAITTTGTKNLLVTIG